MYRIFCTLLLASCCVSVGHAQASAFRHDPAHAPAPGTVWRWAKSNRDGSQPWHLEMYVASPTRIEVLKWVEGGADVVEVSADIDPARAMPVNLQQWNTSAAGREPRVYGHADAQQLSIQIADGPRFSLAHGGAPLHLWGFDLMGLAFLLPHLAQPGEAFELGIVDPNRPGADGKGFAQGTAVFEPVAEETLDGVPARKYRIRGAVFGEAEGALWVAREGGRLLRAEHPIPTSTDWQDWKLAAAGVARMDGIEWERHKLRLAQALRAED